jgi:hypothetical protein
MDWRDSLYGYIGMQDHTLDPIIRPGSFVQIEQLNFADRSSNP